MPTIETSPASELRQLRQTMYARETEPSRSAIWEPPAGAVQPANVELEPAIATALAALFVRPAPPAPTHQIAGDMKEAEIRAELALLTPVEALLVKRRLERGADEALVRTFHRLAQPRRERLLAFLGDARRRAALAARR